MKLLWFEYLESIGAPAPVWLAHWVCQFVRTSGQRNASWRRCRAASNAAGMWRQCTTTKW